MDSTVIATSLPAIAADIGTSPLTLKLAITSYLLSLAVFIPASGWTADRFGARMVFSIAIGVFMIGSIGCALSQNVTHFVIARILQGMGGAMMTPVGRLVLLRSIDKSALVNAMTWVTVPALIGPVIGPPLGGFITTYINWQWIFWINIPIGILGVILATRFIGNFREKNLPPLDLKGFVLSGVGLSGLAFGFTTIGQDLLPQTMSLALMALGIVFCFLYVRHAKAIPAPLINLRLLKIETFYASVVGGFLFRVGIGAMPFLLPLMFQLGFGMTPFQSGMLTFAGAVGAITMKTAAAPILRRFGFRRVLLVNAVIACTFIAAVALFQPSTPQIVILAILLAGGFFRSLQFTSINALAYADIAQANMSQATSFASVAQQLSLSAGVAIGALVLEFQRYWHGTTQVATNDFALAFIVVALVSATSIFIFKGIPKNAGASLSGRGKPVASPSEAPPPG